MAKTKVTLEIESLLYNILIEKGEYPCMEVTAGIGGSNEGRVDLMSVSYDLKIKCFEIKVSKSDFHSNAKKTFVGHYNYFVVTKKLYEMVKDLIPIDVGIYVYDETNHSLYVEKKAKKQIISEENKIVLLLSMVRSLSREVKKFNDTKNESKYIHLSKKYNDSEKEVDYYRKRLNDLENKLFSIMGGNSREIIDTAYNLTKNTNNILRFKLEPKNQLFENEEFIDREPYEVLKGIIKNNNTIQENIPWLNICIDALDKKSITALLHSFSLQYRMNDHIFTEEKIKLTEKEIEFIKLLNRR